MNTMTPGPYVPLMHMHRCTRCRRLISMQIGKPVICLCGGTFELDRAFHPVGTEPPAPVPHCDTCMDMRYFVIASKSGGTRTSACPDCHGGN